MSNATNNINNSPKAKDCALPSSPYRKGVLREQVPGRRTSTGRIYSNDRSRLSSVSDNASENCSPIRGNSPKTTNNSPKGSPLSKGNSPKATPAAESNAKDTHPHSSTNFSLNKNEEFTFRKPEECPVFTPTEEDFRDPLVYIAKIRPIAEKCGIAKVIPPKSWAPPFTVDVDKLKFTPRVQRLNELEAKTRIKLNFLDQIAKFWELQGSSLKIPMVERKALDLYTLQKIVEDEGGLDTVTKERKWSRVAHLLGYPSGKGIGAILKGHYDRILHPYEIHKSEKVIDIKLETESDDRDYKPHGIVSRQQISPPNENTARRSKRFANSNASCGLGMSIKDEVKKEDEFPTKVASSRMSSCGRMVRSRMAGGNSTTSSKKSKTVDPLAKYICHTCNRGDVEEAMLLCDGCDDSYHTFCLLPPLNDIPKGDWRCPKCVVEEVSKPTEAFGFEQAQREYTLQQFGEMADQFKSEYFKMAVHLVPTDLVEREFWRIVSCIDEDVTVEYGADLHTMDHGSGFPTRNSMFLLPGDQEYAESNWNLNNLPLLEDSILGHINADISGMKVPWMYVGMCFATFCWHNEDHWSYSINYMHWGEPKTWYGVPGSSAEAFEATMKSTAPELFASQPDLLHQLVTIMNPNILMDAGVPVYRTDQRAGEFVITFPRAYHAGFNQGYNFAEAVNFAPADWLKMGRECINHYSTLRRFCVFSHDELVCKMALEPDKLSYGIATACYLDMAEMVDMEKKLRKSLLEWGVTKADRESFELIPDDERQCESCKTTCFLSAVACACTKSIVCLRHYTELCKCPAERHVLRYRYTLDELPLMLKQLKAKAHCFEQWLTKVRDVLDPATPTTITLEELQCLTHEAESKRFPNSLILDRLNSAVLEAEKCVTVIQQLDINKMRTRARNNESTKYKLTVEELNLFVKEIDNLCCVIQEGQSVRELQQMGKDFLDRTQVALADNFSSTKVEVVEKLIEEGSSLCIDLQEVQQLRERVEHATWFNHVQEVRESSEKVPYVVIKNFIKDGLGLAAHPTITKVLSILQQIAVQCESWEGRVRRCFEKLDKKGGADKAVKIDLKTIEHLLEQTEHIDAGLPSEPALRDAFKKAKEWMATVDVLQTHEHYPYFHTLEEVTRKGTGLPIVLPEVARLQTHLDNAIDWKEKTSKAFLRKHTQLTLLEVLSPRSDLAGDKSLPSKFNESMVPSQMVDVFKNAEEKELSAMKEMRTKHMAKNPLLATFCVCKGKFHGTMYNCQLCKDWFHEGCVPQPRNTVRTNLAGPANRRPLVPQLNLREKDRETKYLCDGCMRSRRPRLETILSLLVSLQRLPIRMPEGEALQCLTERAMNWQDRARQAFGADDVAAALAVLSAMSQKAGEGAAGSKSAQAAAGDKRKRPKKKLRKLAFRASDDEDKSDGWTSDDDEMPQLEIDEDCDLNNQNEGSDVDSKSPTSPMKLEHAYSVPNSGGRKSESLSLSKTDLPLIQLTKETRESLEELMMEGDLLEVSLDETLHLWRILNAAKPALTELAYIKFKYNIPNHPIPNDSKEASAPLKASDSSAAVSAGAAVSVSQPSTTAASTSASKTTATSTSSTTANTSTTTSTTTSAPVVAATEAASATPAALPAESEAVPLRTKRGRKMKIVMKEDDNMSGLEEPEPVPKPTPSKKSEESTSRSSGSTSRKRKRAVSKKSSAHAKRVAVSDDDDECSARSCHKPSGREVDWVQCDGGCDKWFHMFCVGLDKDQVKPEDDFVCKQCKKLEHLGKLATAGAGSPAVDDSNSKGDADKSHNEHNTSSKAESTSSKI